MSGVSIQNMQKVSLWIIDHDKLSLLYSTSSEQQTYIESISEGIKKMRRLRHPFILNIIDIQDNIYDFQFSTEPVTNSLRKLIGTIDTKDAAYFSYQIAEALNFLHNDAKIVHFNINPDNIFLNQQLQIKLFNFNLATLMLDDGIAHLPFEKYELKCGYPDIGYVAPEIIIGRQCSSQTDVFSFALVLYEIITGNKLLNYNKVDDYVIGKMPVISSSNIDPKIGTLIKNCICQPVSQRPQISMILNNEIFHTEYIETLKGCDEIFTKDLNDKFIFFKEMKNTLNDFSTFTMKNKIIPLLIEESKNTIKLAPILLDMIFHHVKDYSEEEFRIIAEQVSFLMKISDPPQITFVFIRNIEMLFEKTMETFHHEYLFPLINNSLRSNNKPIVKECIENMPHFINKVPISNIIEDIFPNLIAIVTETDDIQLLYITLKCIVLCKKITNDEELLLSNILNIYKMWSTHKCPEIASALYEIFACIDTTPRMIMEKIIPFASDVASSGACDPFHQNKLCDWIITNLKKYKEINKLDLCEEPLKMKIEPNDSDTIKTKPQETDMGSAFEEYFDTFEKDESAQLPISYEEIEI